MHQSQSIATERLSPSTGTSTASQANRQLDVKLTPKEQEVLQWCAKGKTSGEIALILQCTESGVNFHVGNIRLKFGVSSRSAALMKATFLGLVQPFN